MSATERPTGDWKTDLHTFFEARSREVRGLRASDERLCYVSGREPRLWADPALYADLIDSIRTQLALEPGQRLLEVGCAAGFLTRGLAACVARYVGVDLSRAALDVARSLGLDGTRFAQADAVALPFVDGTFDRVICYDVFTNIAEWTTAAAMVMQMVRVTRPGGSAMVGSLADEETRPEFEHVVQEVARGLEARYGPVAPPVRQPFWKRWGSRRPEPTGQIVCYYFKRRDFMDLGAQLGVLTEIHDIHPKNPYHGFRFNVIYRKPAR